jgi:hypothetical protein
MMMIRCVSLCEWCFFASLFLVVISLSSFVVVALCLRVVVKPNGFVAFVVVVFVFLMFVHV